jgi:phosphate acyltransferase
MTDRIIRIAIDAMGGDDVPDVLVKGAVAAVAEYDDVAVTLVGDENRVQQSIDSAIVSYSDRNVDGAALAERLSVVHADDVIGMDESPSRTIRTRKAASVVVANKLCSDGECEAVISAGNTGAAMASSLLIMGRLQGVQRPAIMAIFPSMKNIVTILDVGANADCKPNNLFQFAVMASIYCEHVLQYEHPRVALLNIGEERSKGNELTNAAYSLLEQSHLNFIGNIEGRDIFTGSADVVVCDGFVGNVLLKFGESIFGFVVHMLKKKLDGHPLRMLGASFLKPVFGEIKRDMSPEDYGGAPLLGVDGVSIICHGNSSPTAIKNAVRVARRMVLDDVNELIKREISKQNGTMHE